ncbi:MAG: sigma-70 family RNA polymerase sigma factor [Gemmatimonadota bacterium]|nr:sigma-70 family RNA polymerase sigma factor [Gemmatimonadota bacterium]MDE2784533.1 sigma-70 family RNA polymerase sigma factor [Gemmatimonadota bacterium]MDE2863775.1 sigma-70 family RNA polymerase sigma factor [Gemmatimonadota bacterium]MXV96982.1 sigma-70 family RNA polymerase sigma factor [Gemmatimonadota bacterium]MYE16710.1 sigma-70 family RNA polymerase sigma factor [Gemmatimonadota bacterium]
MNSAAPAGDRQDSGEPIDLARLYARDPRLLTQLVQDLSPRIWVAIRSYARDDDHADDLLQDCWVRILERLEGFKQRGPFSAWAIAVSTNLCKVRVRKKKLAGAEPVALDNIGELPGSGPDPLDDLQARRERNTLYGALGTLPDREREAIVLRVLEGRDVWETASALGVTPDTVRSLLQRGMYRLRRMPQIRVLLGEWMGE